MKTTYTIKNFRVFDKKGVSVDISPLTFLVGCNSSGKSSIVKSLLLLKTFFSNKISENNPVLGSAIDFTVKPNDSLGTFKNVVRSSSRDKTVSLSYKVYSKYINDSVIVSLTLSPGELGNAVVSSVKISKEDGKVIAAAKSGSLVLSGDLSCLKDSFKQYLVATRFKTRVKSMLPPDPGLELSDAANEKIQRLYEEALKVCSAEYVNAIYEDASIVTCRFRKEAEQAIDKFLDSSILTYFSLFDEIKEFGDSEDIRSFFLSRIKESEDRDVKEAIKKAINYVCDEYTKSGLNDFLSYYRSLEDGFIMNARSVNAPSIVGGGRLMPWSFAMEHNREDIMYTIARSENDNIHELHEYYLVYDLLSHLSEKDAYSFLEENEYGEPSAYHFVHPLYASSFKEFVNSFFMDVFSKDVTNDIAYISSSRIQVRRMYPMEDKTEFSLAVRRYFETKTRYMSLNPPITVNVADEDGIWHHPVKVTDFMPGDFMNKWLRVFNIGDHISLDMDKNGLGLLLKVYRSASDKQGVLLADLGYGITQLFSILIQIEEMILSGLYEKYKGMVTPDSTKKMGGAHVLSDFEVTPLDPKTLAIEEPEIHLHPKYQSLLAEMIYEAYKDYSIHFIVETHSEYLLRKIQTLVGLKKLSPEELSMIYVEDDSEVAKGAAKVRKIPVKEDGRLAASFGPGFYDEADNLSLELFTNMGR